MGLVWSTCRSVRTIDENNDKKGATVEKGGTDGKGATVHSGGACGKGVTSGEDVNNDKGATVDSGGGSDKGVNSGENVADDKGATGSSGGASDKGVTSGEEVTDDKGVTVDSGDKKDETVACDADMGASQRTPVHVKARGPEYPGASDVKKTEVSDANVPWNVKYEAYKPVEYTAPSVVAKPVWADADVKDDEYKKIKFNEVDGKTNRVSFMGKYKLENGIPQNPQGRTGMTGRGLLGKWGPNHAADPIVTRWKRDKENKIVTIDNKRVLEFVSILRGDTKQLAIPGGMVDNDEQISQTLKREFGEEALNSLELDEKQQTKEAIEKLFKSGDIIYKGYVDDPRNTDNAWMETVAVNFHDTDGTTVGRIPLHAGDDAAAVQWLTIDRQLNLYASHIDFIERTCKKHDAFFLK